jgi:flagellar hook-length control protein FliK
VAEKITGKKETVKDSKNEINLQNNQKQTKEIDSRVEQVRVQPESQQVLKNVKTDSIAQATKTAPTIQVNSDVNIEAIKSSKNPVKEALDQPSLSQEVLDKTNARVVSIETQANSDNLLNRQNAQEQSVKLSIEGLQQTQNNQNTNSTNQISFDKNIENTQQPKEISKSDILSQIHTKFEQLKDQGTTKISMVLKPEHLGKINLELINGKEGFTARMTADNTQVKELLDKNIESLKSTLSTQGVNVNNISVKVSETQAQSNEMFMFGEKDFSEQAQQQFKNDSSHKNDSTQTQYELGEETKEESNISAEENNQETKKTTHEGEIDYKV